VDLQADLDLWMCEFNEARPHQGKWCFGKTPMQTFLALEARVSACYQASRAIARQLATGIRADYADLLPRALAWFEDDFEACIAHLRCRPPMAASFGGRITLRFSHPVGARLARPVPHLISIYRREARGPDGPWLVNQVFRIIRLMNR
jgi:hypothetical protein